jgi:hypothetical protein
MSDVTRLLDAAASGDPNAAAQLLPLVYDELRARGADPGRCRGCDCNSPDTSRAFGVVDG